MNDLALRLGVLALAVIVVVTLATAPALAHAGHDSHEEESGSGLSIWPFFAVLGTVATGGSLLAGYRWDVDRQYAVGAAIGGAVMAVAGSVAVFL